MKLNGNISIGEDGYVVLDLEMDILLAQIIANNHPEINTDGYIGTYALEDGRQGLTLVALFETAMAVFKEAIQLEDGMQIQLNPFHNTNHEIVDWDLKISHWPMFPVKDEKKIIHHFEIQIPNKDSY